MRSDGDSQSRAAGDSPDVYLDVPEVHVGEIYLDVENLNVQLSLQARLANLVQVSAGVHVHADKIEVDLKEVDAEAVLKVRLEQLAAILERALTTIERNPEIIQGLVDATGTAVDSVGNAAEAALAPGGAAAEAAEAAGAVGKSVSGKT